MDDLRVKFDASEAYGRARAGEACDGGRVLVGADEDDDGQSGRLGFAARQATRRGGVSCLDSTMSRVVTPTRVAEAESLTGHLLGL